MTDQQIKEAQRRANRLKRIKGFYVLERKEDFDDDKQITKSIKSSATGFLITPDGFVLTACHAIEESAKIEVLYNKKKYTAEVV
jgi:S1-C subfamily serine protease